MAERDQISEDEAIRQAKRELGAEAIAKLQEMPPEVRKALLKALNKEPQAPSVHRNPGGRPKGSGQDYATALRRMAELQVDDSSLSLRDLAERVNEEMKAVGLGFTAEALRKEYRPEAKREKLRAAILKQRQPKRPEVTIRPVNSAKLPASAYDSVNATVRQLYEALTESMRPLIDQTAAKLAAQAAVTKQAQELSQFSAISEALRLKIEGDYASLKAKSMADVFSARIDEQVKKLRNSISEEASRGLAILLGKKPY
ncbi:MAG: hypothetical protein JF614_31520 [Acidobacteria bacterium]|nr:hypothetical protein [Acidobacteriota bacterium]